MTRLVVCSGMTKRADASVDGPSFEMQFGILANAQVADKFPKLDRHKLAFQLVDKADDNSKAVGVSVYSLGKSVIMVPCFFGNGAVRSGDMMLLADTQQFLPLSDPWLAWVQNKDLDEAGSVVEQPDAGTGAGRSEQANTIRQDADPIVKTACVYLKGLLRTDPDLTRVLDDTSVLDTVLGMGKTAAESMLDNLIDGRRLLNATLRFYDGDALDGFAKKAAELGREIESVSVVLPFTEEAKALTPDEKDALARDGYVIKRASEDGSEPDVIRASDVKKTFEVVSRPGMMQLLKPDGGIAKYLVMRDGGFLFKSDRIMPEGPEEKTRSYGEPGMTAARIMHSAGGECGLVAVMARDASGPMELPENTMMAGGSGNEPFKPEMISGYGKPATPTSVEELHYDDWLLCPDGRAYRIERDVYAHNDGWYSAYDNYSVVVGSDKNQVSPVCTLSTLIIPQGSRILAASKEEREKSAKDRAKGVHSMRLVTWSTLDAFLSEYRKKHYRKLKVASNGTEASVDGGETVSVKEASLKLVRDYGISPEMARTMIADVCAKSGPGRFGSETYLLSKTAGEDDPWQDASMPTNDFRNVGPRRELVGMPTVLEDPEELKRVMEAAAEDGIKEVFDVSVFKLLVRQNRFLEEIHGDMPMFMRVLDSLCRKLFLLYWHTEAFEKEYGTVKLKVIEEGLRNALDSLSDIVVFFKLRTVDGTIGGTGNDGGELVEGHDI